MRPIFQMNPHFFKVLLRQIIHLVPRCRIMPSNYVPPVMVLKQSSPIHLAHFFRRLPRSRPHCRRWPSRHCVRWRRSTCVVVQEAECCGSRSRLIKTPNRILERPPRGGSSVFDVRYWRSPYAAPGKAEMLRIRWGYSHENEIIGRGRSGRAVF